MERVRGGIFGISTILKHDAKVTSYKIALLRAINGIVLSFPALQTLNSADLLGAYEQAIYSLTDDGALELLSGGSP